MFVTYLAAKRLGCPCGDVTSTSRTGGAKQEVRQCADDGGHAEEDCGQTYSSWDVNLGIHKSCDVLSHANARHADERTCDRDIDHRGIHGQHVTSTVYDVLGK